MALELNKISAVAREHYINLGRHYSSVDTLKQADHTLDGLKTHGEVVLTHGLAQRDATKLTDAREALEKAGVGREEAVGEKRTNARLYREALRAGKNAREQARTVLEGAQEDLSESSEEEDIKAANGLSVTLTQTRAAGSDATALAAQLTLLRTALEQGPVAAASSDRQGEQVVELLGSNIERLGEAARTRVLRPGTPAHTEHLDLLDGIIIKIVRRARKAARSAARAKGQPALADAFKLDRLYGK
jgi:hypothetical protein